MNAKTFVRCATTSSIATVAGLIACMLTTQVRADAIADGSTVRFRSNSIEAGWHTGRLKRDDRHCSMIQLDRPTEHGYTLVALLIVDALQLGRTGQWRAIDARRVIASEPSHCLAEGAD